MKAARYITGWARARVMGVSPEKLLTALAERGITFWDASPVRDFTLTVCVPSRAAKLVPALAAAVGCEGEIVEVHGLGRFLRRMLRRRPSALIVLAAVLMLLAASLSRVWDIEITGNETIPDGVIRQALAECGVDIGARWTEFSQDSIRNGVILRVPGIRWMTVTMQGSKAYVIVREKRTYITPVDEAEAADIVADRAGLVTAVYAKRGTAEAEAGDMLLPGDTVIGGYATGRFGVQGTVRAIGYAEARTWYELTAAAPLSVSLKEPEGAKYTRYALILGKTRINFYKGSSICPVDCDKIIESYTLSRPGVFTLPVTVEKTVWTEYGVQAERAEELRGELEASLAQVLSDRMGETGQIVSAAFTASEKDGALYVTLHAECLERIGASVPLSAERRWLIESKIPKDTEDTDT